MAQYNMPLLIIQEDCPTHEARDWLAELIEDVLDRLDMDECVGMVNGEAVMEEITRQIGYLSPSTIDNLFANAIKSLLVGRNPHGPVCKSQQFCSAKLCGLAIAM